jgi:hypothetical protein
MRRTSASFSTNGVVRGSWVERISRMVERGRFRVGFACAMPRSTRSVKSADRIAMRMRTVAGFSSSARFSSMNARMRPASTSDGRKWSKCGPRCFRQR